MKDKHDNNNIPKPQKTTQDPRAKEAGKKGTKDQKFFERWKDAECNNMGNDIAGEIKIANSNGNLEGGKDKRWHMEEEE